MICLYNGRLIIERLKLSDNWQATYKLPNSEQITIDLCTPDIRQAFVRAQYHYLALRDKQPVEQVQEAINAKARCWFCHHWLPRTNQCSFGFPEAALTNGRYASRCNFYEQDKESPGPHGQG
jgi:hypothetical protein